MKRLPIGLTIVTALSLAILIALGTWQLQRLHWKLEVLARIEAARTAAPISLDEALRRQAAGEDMEWRRVRVDCLQPDPRIAARSLSDPTPPRHGLIYGVVDGEIAWRDLAPCAIGPNRLIPLERGVVRSLTGVIDPAGISVGALPRSTESKERWAVVGTPVSAIGVFRHAEVGPSMFAQAYPTSIPGGFRASNRDHYTLKSLLDAGGDRRDRARLITDHYVSVAAETPPDPALSPSPTPADIPNRHLEYALTWYGLAGALLAIYAAMLWRRFKAR
ncbi:MAG: SURF1 family protein [Caulobacteraceae bacterium]|nr:MAG: SURF1 family protein [Caulobacteraceae bacterium]